MIVGAENRRPGFRIGLWGRCGNGGRTLAHGEVTVTEETIFTAALEKGSKADRTAYLAEACAGDEALRKRVEALLGSHAEADFLRTSAAERAAIAFGEEATAEMTGSAVGADPEPPLEFLTPSEKPGSLGLLGHYEVLEVIGRGGMGVVLRAFDENLHRVVAIKVIAAELATSAAARRRFAREAQAAAAVSHDHIVTIHAVEGSGRIPYLVMQYVAGMSLQERLQSRGPLQLHEILRIGMQVASGLAAAHAQGLIHRDIKPANILLENGVERVKLTDFGLARAADDASLTQSGVVAGTPQYMAPEQARGEQVDRRSDLFSLGSVLYAMCTGRAPFRASGTMAVLKRVCEELPSPIRETNPEIPTWLVAIIEKLHAKDPAERYQAADKVAEILGRHLAHVQNPLVVPLPLAGRLAQPPPSRRLWHWGAVAAVLVSLVGGLGLAEAIGVTQLTATVIRIFTPDATLVVEANDPAVNVTIEGDGGLVITGAGAREVRLHPGSYRLHATKGGKPVRLDRDLVTILRNDKQVVRVRLEGDAVTAGVGAGRGAFVVLVGRDVAERKFDTLAEAVMCASDGDSIEVRGNGPFLMPHLEIKYPLTIRAGAGFRPVIACVPQGISVAKEPLIFALGPLRLEGLELRCDVHTAEGLVQAAGPLAVANCRFLCRGPASTCIKSTAGCRVRNCEISALLGAALGFNWKSTEPYEVTNCLLVGHNNFLDDEIAIHPAFRITRNTLVTTGMPTAFLYILYVKMSQVPRLPTERLRIFASENVIDSEGEVFDLLQPEGFLPLLDTAEAEAWLLRRVEWREERNLYHTGNPLLGMVNTVHPGAETTRGHTLAEWDRYWGLHETGSTQAVIRFHGGDLRERARIDPEQLTPEDFRLRPDSAGYRAGPDGKDLGADVDLVGPGPAYERWKKTPEYRKWLEETRTLK